MLAVLTLEIAEVCYITYFMYDKDASGVVSTKFCIAEVHTLVPEVETTG